ncbi:hypothetical protein SAMN06265371_101163 [Lutibacter agarilyticus]|uniref:Uncharacterized protein n=1 Tax=Lutibacter agarilyticus TaxID=1109740 RepID=A0A238VB09_9FLAO|nr:hypothetical protein [Lutibacter agarilyticus]SNR31612.1 hypothetical protein SAMN06265371_101163 [Lutibacter agarilyticus]
MSKRSLFFNVLFICQIFVVAAQEVPKILTDKKITENNYLPDFSYAGYHNGEVELPNSFDKIVLATDFGVVANDGLDDSKALLKALEATKKNARK